MTDKPMIPPAVVMPPLQGRVRRLVGEVYDGRYRVYTHTSGVPYGALPPWLDGGPARVAIGDWNVSQRSWCRWMSTPGTVPSGPPIILNVTRRVDGQLERHPLDGTGYDSAEDADRATYDAGLIGFMVYEKNAASYGLPTG